MLISTKGRYALRMMVDIALHSNGNFVSLREVSHRQSISMKYMEQIVSPLAKAGILQSERGPQGGYRLVQPPSAYTVGDILHVTEGPLLPPQYTDTQHELCTSAADSPTLPFWQGLAATIDEYLNGTTLQDLIDQANRPYVPDYSI